MTIGTEQHRTNLDNSTSVPYDSSASTKNPSPPYSVPLFVSLLISESLFTHNNSPVTTMIIPFIMKEIPYAYFIISIMEFIAALLTKWSYGPSYSLLSPVGSTSLPDLKDIRQVYSPTTVSNQNADSQQTIDTPIFPKGMTFNISFSSPFSAPRSKLSTLFTIELKEIRNVPGYVIPLTALLLYVIFEPFFRK